MAVQRKKWETEECGTYLHWFMVRLVYAAVESRLVFQELYLKITFIKAVISMYSFCRQGNSYGMLSCLSLDSYGMLPTSFAMGIFSNILSTVSCLVSSFCSLLLVFIMYS